MTLPLPSQHSLHIQYMHPEPVLPGPMQNTTCTISAVLLEHVLWPCAVPARLKSEGFQNAGLGEYQLAADQDPLATAVGGQPSDACLFRGE